MSLLSNAIYAVAKKAKKLSSNDEGKANVVAYQPEVDLRVAKQHGVVRISIHDNGIGIEEGIISKIFDPFFTTKPTAEAPQESDST